MGSDGAKGAVVLKRAGAYVIAQDEASSVVWGMPGSTVAAGAANEVLPIDQIGPSALALLGMGGWTMDVSPQEFRDVQTLVRTLCGLVLTDDKTYLVRTRLEPVVRNHNCKTFGEYLGRLQQSHARLMRDELVEALTTGETSFYRDTHPFESFRKQILPELGNLIRLRLEQRDPYPQVRIWSAGCSTGQEPYSIAMCVLDFVSANPTLGIRPEHFSILATDVSSRSLSIAREGKYHDRDLERGLTPEMRSRFFQRHGEQWIANSDLRKLIEFRRLNFIDPVSGMRPFDVIFCRNVMIYFDTATRQRLCDQFHQLLAPGGLLILGAAESLYGLTTALVSLQLGQSSVYRKV
jgi:chemotaxis protein methyltransferase CheR